MIAHASPTVRSAVVPLLLAALALGGPAAAEPTAPTGPTEEVATRVVQVPVEVTRNGEPVRGLGIDDFVVEDEGRKQRLIAVDVVDRAATAGEPFAAAGLGMPVTARRHVLLLIDMTNASGPSLRRAVAAARTVLEEGLLPTDLVAVAVYRDSGGLAPLVSFTPDRRQALAALETIGAPDSTSARPDPLSLTLYEPSGLTAEAPSRGGGLAAGAAAEADAELLDSQDRAIAADRRTALRQMAQLTDGLEKLAAMLASVPARKHVVFLSEGFDNSLMTATESRGRMEQSNVARDRGEIWNVKTEERFGDAARISTLDDVVRAMQQSDCVLHTVDIGAALAGSSEADLTATQAGDRGTRQNQGLTMLASGTGGRYVLPSSDLVASVGTILESTSVTYVLSYAPDRLQPDGSWHKLKVKVPDVRGARVSARPGYFAPTSFQAQDPTRRRLDLAARLLDGIEGGEFGATSLAVPFATADGAGVVPVVTEIDGKSLLGDAGPRGSIGLEVYVYAQAEDGSIRDLFTQRLGIDPLQAGEALRTHGIKHYGTLELAPGRYVVRVLVVESATGRSHLGLVPVEVPEGAPGALALTPPLISDPPSNWLLARLDRADDAGEKYPFPFFAGDAPFLPAARGRSADRGTWSILVLARNLGGDAPTVRAQLADGDGRWSRAVEATGVRRLASGIDGYETLSFDLPEPPQQATALRVTVVDGASGTTAETEIALAGSGT